MLIGKAPGFVSIEILAPMMPHKPEWTIIERFRSFEEASLWLQSDARAALFAQVKPYLAGEIIESPVEPSSSGITEVFVTEVAPEDEEEYLKWIAKIHQVEACFPGFCGLYIQSPETSLAKNWLTLLQFDTKENLDRWLLSSERKELLEEAKSLVKSLERHRVISPYAGWFSSFINQHKALPAVWKQTMLVLLVLYPIVMLQLKFLMPQLASLNQPVAVFISNIISVTLISWPLMPLAILFLSWWLTPEKKSPLLTYMGTLVLVLLYLLEIWLFVAY